jgi:hypothetical protein
MAPPQVGETKTADSESRTVGWEATNGLKAVGRTIAILIVRGKQVKHRTKKNDLLS